MPDVSVVSTSFDYSAILDPLFADQLRNRADEIRALARGIEANYLEIGKQLLATKDQLAHGQFQAWVAQACGFSHRTATRLMTIAREFGQSGHSVHFGVSILEQLAAAPDPQAALAEAKAIAEAGEPVTRDRAKGIRDDGQAIAEAAAPAPAKPVTGMLSTADQPAGDPPDAAENHAADPGEAELARVLAAFAQGSEVKSTSTLCRLTGLSDQTLADALETLVERGELHRIGESGQVFKRAWKRDAMPAPAYDQRPDEREQAIEVLGSRIRTWLQEQGGPRGIMQMIAAVEPSARLTNVVAALEHMIALDWIERVSPTTFRAIPLTEGLDGPPKPWTGPGSTPANASVSPAPTPIPSWAQEQAKAIGAVIDCVLPRTTPDEQPGEAAAPVEPEPSADTTLGEGFAANQLTALGVEPEAPAPASSRTAEEVFSNWTVAEARSVLQQLYPLRANTPDGLRQAWTGEEVTKLLGLAFDSRLIDPVTKWSSGSPWLVGYVLTPLGREVLNALFERFPEAVANQDPAPPDVLSHLEKLLNQIKTAEHVARDVTKITAQDGWRKADAETLKAVRTAARRAQGLLEAAQKHLVALDAPLTRAIVQSEAAASANAVARS